MAPNRGTIMRKLTNHPLNTIIEWAAHWWSAVSLAILLSAIISTIAHAMPPAQNPAGAEPPLPISLGIDRALEETLSSIQGRLSANGRLVQINRNGILVGPGFQVDANGFSPDARPLSRQTGFAGSITLDLNGKSAAPPGLEGGAFMGEVSFSGRLPMGRTRLKSFNFQLYGFLDAGRFTASPNGARQGLAACGLGMRFSLDKGLRGSLELAHPLIQKAGWLAPTTGGDQRIMFTLSAPY